MDTRTLGEDGPTISRFGLGCMGMSAAYGPSDDGESLATLELALHSGVTFWDTADFYGSGHNELLIGKALRGCRGQVVLSVKFGALRTPDGGWSGFDGRPEAIGNFLAMSLRRLNTDYIDLYVPARIDPKVPIEETVGALARWVEKGHIRCIGLSEASAATIRRARAVHPIAALQIEYSLLSRGIEADVLPLCRDLGMTLVAYGALGRGLLTGKIRSADALPSGDGRRHFPRFQPENLARNVALVDAFVTLAHAQHVHPAQLALAWVAAQGEHLVPLLGVRNREQLRQSLAAADIHLTASQAQAVAAAIPAEAVAGTRYHLRGMAQLDGNR